MVKENGFECSDVEFPKSDRPGISPSSATTSYLAVATSFDPCEPQFTHL